MTQELEMQQLFELLVKSSIKLDKISRELNSEFTILESYVLAMIAELENCQAKEIIQALGVSKSALSKVLSNLINFGYILEKQGKIDKRGKILLLSASGSKALANDIRLKNKQILIMTNNLTDSERESLTISLRSLSDGFRAPSAKALQGKTALRAEVERLTRAAGFLGENLLETEISYQKVEILLFLGSKKELATSTLVEAVPFDKTVVSRLVKKLEEDGLLCRRSCEDDARVVFLSLSPAGVKTYERMCLTASHTLFLASQRISNKEITKLLELLPKIVQ